MSDHDFRRGVRRWIRLLALITLTLRLGAWYLQAMEPANCVKGAHEIVYRVDAVQRVHPRQWRLDVSATKAPTCQQLAGARLRLNLYAAGDHNEPDVTLPGVGEVWRSRAQLRPPWGSKNPGGFDYRLWLLSQGYAATGWIRDGHVVASHPDRTWWRSAVARLDEYQHGGLLRALVLGERSGVHSADWELLRRTGTIHLLVVSGLHVGIFAGIAFGLCMLGLRLIPAHILRLHPCSAATVMSVLAVAVMVVVTGMGAPVLRAGLMAAMVGAGLILQRRMVWWVCLAWIGWVSLMLQPRMILQQGFWLSYAAVFSLLWALAGKWRPRTWVSGFVICQAVMLLAMPPWLSGTVGEFPAIAPLANLLAVPVVSMVALPAGIAGWALSLFSPAGSAADWLLSGADFALHLVLMLLQVLQDAAPEFGYAGLGRALLAGTGVIIALLPVSISCRAICLLAWASLILPNSAGVRFGEFRIQVLDVGQGSSAIVDTQSSRLVIDTGPAFASGFNMGEAVVIPALLSTGPARLDSILVTHMDNDHAGGLQALRQRWPSRDALPCEDGRQWRWQGVRFTLRYVAEAQSRNERSCTLVVDNGRRTAYFSGDIGHAAERRLLARLPAAVDLLIAPHHGSKGSSSLAFVRHLSPAHTVISAGKDNRYGHPHRSVVARYESADSHLWITARDGALTWRSSDPHQVQPAR